MAVSSIVGGIWCTIAASIGLTPLISFVSRKHKHYQQLLTLDRKGTECQNAVLTNAAKRETRQGRSVPSCSVALQFVGSDENGSNYLVQLAEYAIAQSRYDALFLDITNHAGALRNQGIRYLAKDMKIFALEEDVEEARGATFKQYLWKSAGSVINVLCVFALAGCAMAVIVGTLVSGGNPLIGFGALIMGFVMSYLITKLCGHCNRRACGPMHPYDSVQVTLHQGNAPPVPNVVISQVPQVPQSPMMGQPNLYSENEVRRLIQDLRLSYDDMKRQQAKQLDMAFELNKTSVITEYELLKAKIGTDESTLIRLLCDKADSILRGNSIQMEGPAPLPAYGEGLEEPPSYHTTL